MSEMPDALMCILIAIMIVAVRHLWAETAHEIRVSWRIWRERHGHIE